MFSQPYNHRKDFESEMSAPDWSDPNMPSGQTGDLNPHFVRMNLNARPFIPNIRAQPFVPGGYGAPFGYPMTGMHDVVPLLLRIIIEKRFGIFVITVAQYFFYLCFALMLLLYVLVPNPV